MEALDLWEITDRRLSVAGLPSIQSTDPSDDLGPRTGYSSHVVSPFMPHVMSQFVFYTYLRFWFISLQTIKDNFTYIKLSLTQDRCQQFVGKVKPFSRVSLDLKMSYFEGYKLTPYLGAWVT